MIVYLIAFAVVVLLAYLADKNRDSNILIAIFVLLFIMMTLFCGLRSVDVGYDTKTYVITTYRYLDSGYSFSDIIKVYGLESGYIALMSLTHSITTKPWLGFLVLSALANIGPFCYFYSKRKNCSLTILFSIYYCTLYLFTFGIMRQSVALSVFFLILLALEKDKKFLSVVLFILGALFHSSMILSIIPLMYLFLINNKHIDCKTKVFALNIMTLVFAFFAILAIPTLQFLTTNGLLNERYAYYLNESSSDYKESIDVEYSLLFLKSMIMIYIFLYFRKKEMSSNERITVKEYAIALSLIVDYFVMFLSFKLSNTDRITWYIFYPAIFYMIPKTTVAFSKNEKSVGAAFLVVLPFIVYVLEKLITDQYHIIPYGLSFGVML